ncbi:allophanate hydrolase-related protein [Thiomicrolovo sp. ZZH C-3]
MAETIKIAVCGAHMRGLPLNHQLTELDATFESATSTAKGYRLYDVPEKVPPRPGMVRDSDVQSRVTLEVWSMPLEHFGAFMVQIASPLCIGTVLLEDGSAVYGFLCEADALKGAEEITSFGGWREYLASKVR